MIALIVFAGIKKSYFPILDQLDNFFDEFRAFIQFRKISSFELQPFLWLMVIPLPQLSARSSLFNPHTLKIVLAHTSRPKTIHQDSNTVVANGIVNSFGGNMHVNVPGAQGRTAMAAPPASS